MNIFFKIFIALLFSLLTACASTRTPVMPGEIPLQSDLKEQDIKTGATVYNQLARKYKADDNLKNGKLVRDIVYSLSNAAAGSSGGNPWHVYIFKDDNFKNAAATQGNYIFVWSGIIKAAGTKDELATVLAHEVSHVLAGHTTPTASEALNKILAGAGGEVAKSAMISNGYYSAGAQLVGQLASLLIQSLIINPESQRLESEADVVGLFLMAKAGYNPSAAIKFWKNLQNDPGYKELSVSFLSSHPSSKERIMNLEKYLPEAMEVYRRNK